MKQMKLLIGCFLGFLSLTTFSSYAAPPNDQFASAIPLNGLIVTTTGSNAGASTEPGEPWHYATTGGSSVWWTWTAPSTGPATISTYNSTFDTVLAIYTGGSVTTLTLVGNSDDSGATVQSLVSFDAVAGTTYRIAVDGSSGTTGNITLNIAGTPPNAGTVSLISTGAVWNYLADGSDQGTGWTALGFNDSTWLNGPAQLGYGDGDEATVVQSNLLDGSRIITTYFRRAFNVSNPNNYVGLEVRLLRDDGAVVYLNGNEVFRSFMPEGTIDYLTLASGVATGTDETTTFYPKTLSPSMLTTGSNVVAVEIHQCATTSSDISFDLELVASLAAPNSAPVVSLTSPTNNARFGGPATILLTANAYDNDGSVTNVAFYRGATRLFNDVSHPYSYTLTNVPLGTHQFTAVATDNRGSYVPSSPVTVTVVNNLPPAVAITTPLNGAILSVPGNIPITATASDSDGIARVDFYQGGLFLGQALTNPYTVIWSNAVAGNYTLRAVATDTLNTSSTSSVNITVTGNYLPSVALTEPAPNASFSAPGPVTFTATASDYDGAISRVDFYQDAVKLGQSTTSPYIFVWNDVAVGDYTLKAVAVDNAGASVTSSPVNISVRQVITPQWVAFNDHNSGVGTGLNVTTYSPAEGITEAGGPLLNQQTGQALSAGVVISELGAIVGTAGTSAAPTNGTPAISIFGGKIDWDGSALFFGPTPSYDGAVVITFTNLTPGAKYNFRGTAVRAGGYPGRWTLATLSGAASSTPAHLPGPGSPGIVTKDWSPYGDGMIAGVQAAWNSGDNMCGDVIGWDNIVPVNNSFSVISSNYHFVSTTSPLGTLADYYVYAISAFKLEQMPGGPTVSITTPSDNARIVVPGSTTISANCAAFSGTITNVAFYANGIQLGADTTSPYSWNWSNPAIGNYALTAVGMDDGGVNVTSAPVNVTVQTNQPPAVALTSPADGSVYGAPSSITLLASASDSQGSVTNVAFYDGTLLLGQVPKTPFTLVWKNPPLGVHALRAVAWDNLGLAQTSSVVNITINPNSRPTIDITGPPNNATFNAGGTISITTSALDSDGIVTNVSFYASGAKLGETTSSPFSYSWLNVPVGGYGLTAVATDNGGLSATSGVVNVIISQSAGPQWVAYNDHMAGPNTAPNVSTYSLPNTPGGPLLNYQTGEHLAAGMESYAIGPVNGYAGGSTAPLAGTPADAIFGGKIDFDMSAFYFGGVPPFDSAVIITFTNLTPGMKYNFRGTSVRGNYYGGRWTFATLSGAVSATPAHITGPGSPGIVTNGWSPYGDGMIAGLQAAWNSGDNLCGDVIGWDDIVPNGTSFSVISSNYNFLVTEGPLGPMASTYCYAINAFKLEQVQSGPMVSFNYPANNALFLLPTNVVMMAVPSGFSGTVTSVVFYAGANRLGTDTVAPYIWNWISPGLGDYALTAVATDDTGTNSTSAPVNIMVRSNQPPTVSFTSPPDNTAFTAPASFMLAATAADDFGVSKVEFYQDGSKLAETAKPPYLYSVNDYPAGNYQFRAVAIDFYGLSATSSLVRVRVTNNVPPIVAITSPANNANITGPTNLTITAAASDPDGTVTRVEFFLNGVKFGEDSSAPYSLLWTNVSITGVYQLQAVATDGLGSQASSAIVTINVQGNSRPLATLTAPQNNSVLMCPTNLLLEATASDPDGSVARVDFYANATLLGSDSTNPYQLYWSNDVPAGFALTAVAIDNATASGTSAPVNVTFMSAPTSSTLIAPGSVWNYYDFVTAEVPGWNTVEFDDSLWLSGPAQLGYGDGDEATVVGFGGNPSSRLPSTYFRQYFMIADWTLYKSLFVNLLRDDGGIVYINGTEVYRNNMPAGPVTFDTFAAGNATDDGINWWPSPGISSSVLRNGINVVAVEIHQATPSSTDISFDLEITGTTTNAAPTVLLSAPGPATVFTGPAEIVLTAAANDSDGTITNLAFYANGTRIGQTTSQPFAFTWSNVDLGTYDLQAIASDNWGSTATSATVRVFVVMSTAPTIASFLPPSGSTLTSLANLTVSFSEPVNGIDPADLLVNGVPSSAVEGSNDVYTFNFPQPLEGQVSVTWAPAHGIVDRENPPKTFNGAAAGETAQYLFRDTAAPVVATVTPVPDSTIASLTQVSVSFSEAVDGVDASDLSINGLPAQKVTGSLAGPYVFEFPAVAAGLAQLSWAAGNGIHDLALGANPLAGSSWSYTVSSGAGFGVVINELMYHPSSENQAEEYIELYNTNASAVNLTGWRITGGVDFDLPSRSVAARGYLVVAADVAAFSAKYPGVTEVVGGGWRGRLSNRGDDVRLRNALGDVVDQVHYASEGDWAIRQRGPLDYNYRGWEWFAAHDGNAINTAQPAINSGQRSLELLNPALPHNVGANWAASIPIQGTPGRVNSTATNNVAPLISEVAHFPAVPTSANVVTISSRIDDEFPTGVGVQLFYRNHTASSPPAFSTTNMLDDGLHNDGLAGDRIYAARLPAFSAGTVIEYYVSATDQLGANRTWPAAARLQSGVYTNQANAQYQVDDENWTGVMPIFRLVLTGTERAELVGINRSSDAEMNVTLITSDGVDTKVRHNCGIRIRGAGSRGRPTPNYRVNIPVDRLWNGLSEINLNSQYIHAQLAGSRLSLLSGMPSAAARAIQIRMNGANYVPSGVPPQGNGDGAGFGTVLLLEPINGEWSDIHFPDDGAGNAYRGSIYPWTANLSYQGSDPYTYPSRGYSKTSNQSENDWSDLINLTYALNDTNNPSYVAGVLRNANVQLFMRYFAVCNAVDYMETSLCRGIGDDYAMYRGIKDPRFLLIPHDFDTDFAEGDSGGDPNRTIWNMLNPPTSDTSQIANFLFPFMRHPEFAPVYYGELKRLIDSTYNPAQMSPALDQQLAGWVPANVINRMKTFVTNRNAYIRSQIPTRLTVNHGLGNNSGYLFTSTPNVTFWGRSHAVDTRAVRVAGTPAAWSAFDAAYTNTLTLRPGINEVIFQAFNAAGAEFARTNLLVWYDDGSVQPVSGSISGNVVWSAPEGPFNVIGDLVIGSGATLTIQPGTTVYLASGANVTVASGGRLVAEGIATAPIRFMRAPGSATSWGGITVNGVAGSPETRLSYVYIEGNGSTAIHSAGGTVWLDHLTFGTTTHPYLALDNSSFVVSDSYFPTATSYFECIHGTGGIKTGGQGIFLRNFFGAALSTPGNYNDVLDFTGGNRPGPIVQFINNVFVGSGDDHLDLDGTDAWIEGNIFLHAHKNGSPDTASAVSGGADAGLTSEVTIIGNIFYDCDHAAMAKEGNFFTLINNTVVHQTHQGGLDTDGAVVCLADDGTAQGAGMYLEGNVLYDIEKLVRNVTTALVTFTNNSMPLNWTGPGGNNSTADPLLTYIPSLAQTTFANWTEAQILWQWFALQKGSPAQGTGPNGLPRGGVIPRGVSIAGEPSGTTSQNQATLTIGPNRTGSGISSSGWPNGSGYTDYRWQLDGGAWSAQTPIGTPIQLNNLANGPHTVAVIGRRDAGLYQDDTVYGPDAVVTLSSTWLVNTNSSDLRLNEILASNDRAVLVGNQYPDLVELYNAGPAPIALAGYSLSDNITEARKFVFPPGATLNGGKYLVLWADSDSTPPGYHLGFALKQDGDQLYLFAPTGRLIDSVTFGPQLTDLSIGRMTDASWTLTVPTFGAANRPVSLGSVSTLKINEWLTAGVAPIAEDFIELFNPDSRPVDLSGLYLSDAPESVQNLEPIPALSFVDASGYVAFIADSNPEAGATHLNFRLAADQGLLGLFAPDLRLIDAVQYGSQSNNVSQGRSPNGSSNIIFFANPSPGLPNPAPVIPGGLRLVINEVLAKNINGLTNLDGSTPEWVELFNPTSTNIVLANMSLSDTPGVPRRFVFPAGASMPPGSYLVILCDSSLPPSTSSGSGALNSGFGIAANGGVVQLFDTLANGGAQLDSISYGVQANDLSIGRIPNGGDTWVLTLPTPSSVNIAVPSLGDPTQIKVNEWMAAPASGEDWFELYNPQAAPVALAGLWLSDDISTPATRMRSPIPALSFLGSGLYGYERFLADGNPAAGPDHTTFKLSAGGESLGVSLADGTLIDGIGFQAQLPGVSEGRLPDGSTNLVKFPTTSTPADANYLPLTNIVVSEILSATPLGAPIEDAIELVNASSLPVDLRGWYLSDARRNLKKYQITNNLVVQPGGYTVLYEYQFNGNPDEPGSFAFDGNKGDDVYLSSAVNGQLTGYRAVAHFGASDPGVSFGPYTNSVGEVDYVALVDHTFGQDSPDTVAEFRQGTGLPNAVPTNGPVVISEIMYHPPDLLGGDNVRDEFIELRNTTTTLVHLYDPAHPTNTWSVHGGIDITLPPYLNIDPHGYVVLVSFDPVRDTNSLAAFTAVYHVAGEVILIGPYSGKLDNGGEPIELYKPGVPIAAGLPDAGYVPQILVDRVRYGDTAPWPSSPDGLGDSLQRVNEFAYGNEPANWTSGAPHVGPLAVLVDTDGDGMADDWELAHGFNPNSAADANLDADGDGLSNLQEYLAGTDPRNAQSTLRLSIVGVRPALLQFQPQPNQAYAIEYRNSLSSGTWSSLVNFVGTPTPPPVYQVTDATVNTTRFYRLITTR